MSPRGVVQEDDPYPLPEQTLLTFTLVACEEVTINHTKKDGSPASFRKWEWTFRVDDPFEFDSVEFKGSSEPKVTNSAEAGGFLPLARPIVEALLGRPLQLGEEVDTDLLIGSKGMGTVRHLEARPRKTGDGFWWNVELDEIFPVYGPNVTGPPPTPAPVPADRTGAADDPWGTQTYDEPPF